MKAFQHLKSVLLFIIVSVVLFFAVSGCTGYEIRDVGKELTEVQSKVAAVAAAVGSTQYGPDETLNLLKALQSGNTASSPFNPYALPIGIGLTGIITMLEALRRKEKGGRKYAEQELKNGNGHNGK